MGENTKIQWADHTWNCWHGCLKVSDGCKNCYMFRDKERYGMEPRKIVRAATKKFREPLKWKEGKVFTCSWSDFFIEEADKWRPEAWEIIRKTPHLIYQILTKRPERITCCMPYGWFNDWFMGANNQFVGEKNPNVFNNVWLGVSIENNESINRINPLISGNARVNFLSIEPLIEDISYELGKEFDSFDNHGGTCEVSKYIHWVIIGGESGHLSGKYEARECKIEWIKEIIAVCRYYQIPVFVKQLGKKLAKELGLNDWQGGDISEWPRELQIRQFPKS